MAKGEGVTIQTIFIVIAVVAFSGLLIAVVIFMNSRDISVALEEMKLYEVRNAISAAEISLKTFWGIAPTQALLDAAKESEAWNWATADRTFVAERLTELVKNVTQRHDIIISRADAVIDPKGAVFTINDGDVGVKAEQVVSASFAQSQASHDMIVSTSMKTAFGKMIDIGSAIGKAGSKLSFLHYVPGQDAKQHYESIAQFLLINYASQFATSDVTVKVTENSASLTPAPDDTGLSLVYDVKAHIEEKQSGRYFDGTTFVTIPLYLNARAQGSQDVFSCSSYNGLFMLNTLGDGLCDAGKLYTCGLQWTSDTARTGDYACTGSYFCSSSEKNGDSSCCAAFGGTIQNVEECTAIAGKNDCKIYDDSGICLVYYMEGECKATQTVQQCSV